MNSPIERTLPGELSHVIIVATSVSSAGTVVDEPNIGHDDHCSTCMTREESHEQQGSK